MIKTIATLLLFYVGGVMADYPSEIPAYIEWEFEMDASKDYEKFLADANNIRKDIDKEIPWYSPFHLYNMLIRTNLNKGIGFKKLKIKYEYATQSGHDDWVDHEGIIEISAEKEVTFGQVLYHLHHFTNNNLHNQDIMAIEGFERVEGDGQVPTYYVFFGS